MIIELGTDPAATMIVLFLSSVIVRALEVLSEGARNQFVINCSCVLVMCWYNKIKQFLKGTIIRWKDIVD